jgi:hypothetical protein
LNRDNSKAMDYVKSLRDPVKRRYANDYLGWLRAGKLGSAPERAALSMTQWKLIVTNVDALA